MSDRLHGLVEECDGGNLRSCDQIANQASSSSQDAVSSWLSAHGERRSSVSEASRILRDYRLRQRQKALVRLRAKLCASGDSGACQDITDENIGKLANENLRSNHHHLESQKVRLDFFNGWL